MGSNALAANPTAATAFINNGGLHSPLTISAVGVFPVCRMPFKIHFGENGGQNRAVLEYESAALGIARQVVPQSAYCYCQMSVLPIELKHFFATANSDDILIEWGTASEMNNKFFTVFKSADGLNWSSIAELKGAGNSSSIKEYSVLDTSPNAGINYYYLMQTDYNGNTRKYNMIFADFGNKEGSINLFPNPFNDKVVITSKREFSDTILEVYDVMGKKANIPFQKQNNFRIELNTSELPKGTYTIKIINLQKVVIKAFESVTELKKNLKILATSREPLGITGEAQYHVPPLALLDIQHLLEQILGYESIQLFEERARLVQENFSLTMVNASPIAHICQRLDGIPLSIELADARVNLLSPEQIALKLDESFNLLTGGSRTAMPRHQTLRASIDWSWRLLSQPEQIILRRLSIFAGGWTLDAADAVCAGNGIESQQVLDVMTQLVAKSLVVVNQETGREKRYRLLEMVRGYAREKLMEAGEDESAHDQHKERF